MGGLDAFDPLQWLAVADTALATLRQRVAKQLDIAAALAEAARAHAAVLAALDGFSPSALLAPLTQTLEEAVHGVAGALPVGDLAAALAGALDRLRGFTVSVSSAIDVADHAVEKLAALGNAQSQFNGWIDGILAKVPETATGALATALADLRTAALATRPLPLAAAWATARSPLATLLADVQATGRLTRLALARGKVQAGMEGAVVAAAVPGLGAWMAAPATVAAASGLSQWAAFDRALAAADSALQTHFDQLALRFPGADGALAALVPAAAETLRADIREAVLRQFGTPMLGLLEGLKAVAALLAVAVAGLRGLVQGVEAKLDGLLAAPQALADLLASIGGIQQRLGQLDLSIYTREVDTVYTALLVQVRALDPRQLVQPLEASRDRLLGLISLNGMLPAPLRGQLVEAKRQLVAKLGALDPDALLLEPLDVEYRALVEPLVAALDISASVQVLIDWLAGLPDDLREQIARVDVSYGQLLAGAPGGGGGGGGGASAGLSL